MPIAPPPGPHADDRRQSAEFDRLGEELAVGAGGLVDQHGQVPVETALRIAHGASLARLSNRPQPALQPVDDHIAGEPSAVVALVDDEPLLVITREESSGELNEPALPHVRNMQVAYLSVGSLVYERAIVLDPFAIANRAFAADGAHGNNLWPVGTGLVVITNGYNGAGLVLQEFVDVVAGSDLFAVYRDRS